MSATTFKVGDIVQGTVSETFFRVDHIEEWGVSGFNFCRGTVNHTSDFHAIRKSCYLEMSLINPSSKPFLTNPPA